MRRTLLTVVAVAVGLLLPIAGGRPVSAEQPVPDLYLEFEESVVAGDPVVISAYLVDPAGNPISGVPIDLSREATFLNVSSAVPLALPLTDVTGLATIVYAPASEGEITVTARFAGTEVFAPVTSSNSLIVQPGPELYREEPPFRVPATNVWMVVGIVAAVWSLYLVAFGALFRIGSAPDA